MSLTTQMNSLLQRKAIALVKGATDIENEMHELVAIKTGRLNQAISTGTIQIRGKVLSIDVGVLLDNVPYDFFVERGVMGKTYNYRRYGSVVYTGIGQFFLKRALDNERENFFETLRKA